jgi:hypothetical protein
MTYRTTCPLCGGGLSLAGCTVWDIEGVPISEDGFDLGDARRMSTSDEIVRCDDCDWLGELEMEEDCE